MSLAEWVGLAATTFVAGLIQGASGFGFAVLATPLFLLFVGPGQAIQIVIILTVVFCAAVLPGLRRAIAPRLLLHLALGSVVGVPIGLAALGHANAIAVRFAIGGTILGFVILIEWFRRRGSDAGRPLFRAGPLADAVAGAVSGATTALTGMSGPPLLIYLLAAGMPPATVRATLIAYFLLCYAATLAATAATLGVARWTWLTAVILVPFAVLGGLVGRQLGDRLGAAAFAALATTLLTAAGLYTLIAAVRLAAAGP